MATISDTFNAMVTEAEQGFGRNETVYYGTLVDGQKFRFRWRRGNPHLRSVPADEIDPPTLEATAKLGLGDTYEAAEKDEHAPVVLHGENHWKELREPEFRVLMVDLLKLHPMAPPLPLQSGDLVTCTRSTRGLFWLRQIAGDDGQLAPYLADDTREPLWVPLETLRRVDRFATGKHDDGTSWRLDLIHDTIRIISGDQVIEGSSSKGKAGANAGFDFLWEVFSNGRPGSWRSDADEKGD